MIALIVAIILLALVALAALCAVARLMGVVEDLEDERAHYLSTRALLRDTGERRRRTDLVRRVE